MLFSFLFSGIKTQPFWIDFFFVCFFKTQTRNSSHHGSRWRAKWRGWLITHTHTHTYLRPFSGGNKQREMKIEQWREKDMNIGATRQLIRRAQPISRERRDGGGGGGEREWEIFPVVYGEQVSSKKWSFTISNAQSCFYNLISLSPTLSLLAFNRILRC